MYGIAVTVIVPCGVAVVAAVVMPHGAAAMVIVVSHHVLITTCYCHSAIVIMFSGCTMVGTGGGGRPCVHWQGWWWKRSEWTTKG